MTIKKVRTLDDKSFVRIEISEARQSYFFASFYLKGGVYYEEAPKKRSKDAPPPKPPRTLEKENKRIVKEMQDLGFDGQRVFYGSIDKDQTLVLADNLHKDKKGNLTEPGIVYGKVTGVALAPDFARLFLDEHIDRAVSILWDRKTVRIAAMRLVHDALGNDVFTIDDYVTLSSQDIDSVRAVANDVLNKPYLESLARVSAYKDTASDILLNDVS